MRARTIRRLMIVALALTVLFGALPLVAAFAALALAHALGCTLHEGAVHTCTLLGHEIGGALYTMAGSGWFAKVTAPVAAMVLVVWAIVALILLMLHRRRARRQAV